MAIKGANQQLKIQTRLKSTAATMAPTMQKRKSRKELSWLITAKYR
jgi:hypothetical protein